VSRKQVKNNQRLLAARPVNQPRQTAVCRECGQRLTAPKTIQRKLCRSCWRVAKVCSHDGGRVRDPASEAVVATTITTSRSHAAGAPDFTAAGRREEGDDTGGG
jgi:uncharacterized protein YlaI